MGILAAALASGLAVVAITVAADRLGGRIGGLLSTAPVTTTAAFFHLAGDGGLALKVAAGGMSLFAAIAAMPLYFYTVKATRRMPIGVRVPAGMVAYVLGFSAGTLILQSITPAALRAWWYLATVALVVIYRFTFMQAPIAAVHLRGPKPALTIWEGLARFAAGAIVIVLVTFAAGTHPVLGAAWAVFPGTFLVSLGVMGFGHGAAFSARASQASVIGGVPLASFLLSYMGLVGLIDATWWAWLSMIPAWAVYFLSLVAIQKVPERPNPGSGPASA